MEKVCDVISRKYLRKTFWTRNTLFLQTCRIIEKHKFSFLVESLLCFKIHTLFERFLVSKVWWSMLNRCHQCFFRICFSGRFHRIVQVVSHCLDGKWDFHWQLQQLGRPGLSYPRTVSKKTPVFSKTSCKRGDFCVKSGVVPRSKFPLSGLSPTDQKPHPVSPTLTESWGWASKNFFFFFCTWHAWNFDSITNVLFRSKFPSGEGGKKPERKFM